MPKIFRGVTPAARLLSCVWSIMKLILRFSTNIIKDWSGPHLYGCLPVLGRWLVTVTAMAAPRFTSAAKHSGAEQMVADFHRSSDGRQDVRNPHALQLADSVFSKGS